MYHCFHIEYHPVVIIPVGARNIEIQELQMSSSYLAVRNLSQKYYLTGGWSIDWPGNFPFAGTTFEYQRSFNRPERLYAPGPTNETLVFEVSSIWFLNAALILLTPILSVLF
jgi:thrombospondin motif-containing protein 18